MKKRETTVSSGAPWKWRTERFAWSFFGDMAHEITGRHRDGKTTVWRRVVFGLYRRIH